MRILAARLRNVMTLPSSASAPSEASLRAMTHDQLLAFALSKLPAVPSSVTQHPASSSPASHSHPPPPTSHPPPNQVEPPSKKRRKPFDMTRYGQRMIALQLNYQGWRFHGFASQPTSENTVEAHLFAALQRTHLITSPSTCAYSRAGRTDVGVSAYAQVVGLRLRSAIAPPSQASLELDYVRVINASLPKGIRVTAWSPVCDGSTSSPIIFDADPPAIRKYWRALSEAPVMHDDTVRRPGQAFSARFDASSRSYKYFFVRGQHDLHAMAAAASVFEGKHDFRNFCRFDENVTNFERVMLEVNIRRVRDDLIINTDVAPHGGNKSVVNNDNEYEMFYIFVRGQAFLWHQVRCMAAVLMDIGMGREQVDTIRQMLHDAETDSGHYSKGRPHYRMASPIPLLLYECTFPKSVVHFISQSARSDEEESQMGDMSNISYERADAHMSECFAEEATKAAVIHAMLQENERSLSSHRVELAGKKQVENRASAKWRRRHFIIDSDMGKHIPYCQRGQDNPLSQKLEKAAEKKRAKEMKMKV